MRSAGATRRTRSSRARPLRPRRPGRASSGRRAVRRATAGTPTTTRSTGSSRPVRQPQGLAAAPVPASGASPGPSATPSPTPVPTVTPPPSPSASSTATASPTPTASPAVTPVPTPTPTPTPTSTPPPPRLRHRPRPRRRHPPCSIAAARALPDDVDAVIAGTLTVPLGALESGHSTFVQDETGGIGLYLDAPVVSSLPAGTTIRVSGTLDTRFAQRVLRAAEAAVEVGPTGELPAAPEVATGSADESREGSRISISGTVDGSARRAQRRPGPHGRRRQRSSEGDHRFRRRLGPAAPTSGDLVVVRGPLGQRDSSGTGTEAYRVLRDAGGRLRDPDAAAHGDPTPTPSASATATPPRARPRPRRPPPRPRRHRRPTPSDTPTASPTPASLTLAAVRALPLGTVVTARGVVTAEAGRTGTPRLLTIGDATGGIAVRLPAGTVAPGRGTVVEVRGPLAAPYGQLEIRPAMAGDIATDRRRSTARSRRGRSDRTRRSHRWTAPAWSPVASPRDRARPRAATSASSSNAPVRHRSRSWRTRRVASRSPPSRSGRRIRSSGSVASGRRARAPSTAIASGPAMSPTSSRPPTPNRARAGRLERARPRSPPVRARRARSRPPRCRR